MYKPCRYYVLIEMEAVEETYGDSKIVVATKNELNREQEGQAIGIIRSFGPTCFKGFEGCESPEQWGVEVGDRIEFNRYSGRS